MFRIIHKQELVIFEEYAIPVAVSHSFETKTEAIRWMMERQMQTFCKVISESLFQQNTKRSNGELREDDIHLDYAIYQAKRRGRNNVRILNK